MGLTPYLIGDEGSRYIDPSGQWYPRDEVDAELAKLREENQRLEAQLSHIEEEGTAELNAAVELRQLLAKEREENQRLREKYRMLCFARASEFSGDQAKIEVLREVLDAMYKETEFKPEAEREWDCPCGACEAGRIVERELKRLEGERG